MKNFETFQNALQNDAALKDAVQSALIAADPDTVLTALNKVAVDNGYDISDAKPVLQPAENGELDDSSMSNITGGSSDFYMTLMMCENCGFIALWSGDFHGKQFNCSKCGGKDTLIGI